MYKMNKNIVQKKKKKCFGGKIVDSTIIKLMIDIVKNLGWEVLISDPNNFGI